MKNEVIERSMLVEFLKNHGGILLFLFVAMVVIGILAYVGVLRVI